MAIYHGTKWKKKPKTNPRKEKTTLTVVYLIKFQHLPLRHHQDKHGDQFEGVSGPAVWSRHFAIASCKASCDLWGFTTTQNRLKNSWNHSGRKWVLISWWFSDFQFDDSKKYIQESIKMFTCLPIHSQIMFIFRYNFRYRKKTKKKTSFHRVESQNSAESRSIWIATGE